MRVKDLFTNDDITAIADVFGDALSEFKDYAEDTHPYLTLFADPYPFAYYYYRRSGNKRILRYWEEIKSWYDANHLDERSFWNHLLSQVYQTNKDKFTDTYPYLSNAFDHITDTVNIDREITKEYASTNTKTYQGTKTIENETTGGDTTKTSVKQTTTTNDTTADEYFGFNGNNARPVNSDTSTSTETMSGEADDNVTTVSTTKNGSETVTDDTEHTDVNEGSDTIKTWTVGHSKNKTTEAVTSLNNLNKMRLFELLAKDFDEILTLKIY